MFLGRAVRGHLTAALGGGGIIRVITLRRLRQLVHCGGGYGGGLQATEALIVLNQVFDSMLGKDRFVRTGEVTGVHIQEEFPQIWAELSYQTIWLKEFFAQRHARAGGHT